MGAGASSDTTTIKQERAALAECRTPSFRAQPSQQFIHTPGSRGAIQASHSLAVPITSVGKRGNLDRSAPGRWEVEEFPGEWKGFDPETSAKIEEAFLNGGHSVSVVTHARLVTIFLDHFYERLPTGTTKDIRRVLASSSVDAAVAPASPVRQAPVPSEDAASSSRVASANDLASRQSLVDPFSVTEGTVGILTRSIELQEGSDALRPVLVSTIAAHDTSVYGAMFCPSGDKIVTGAKDGTCKYWEVQTSYLIASLRSHPGSVLSCAINDRWIATGCEDCAVRVFAVGDTEPQLELEGHEHKVYSVSFTCDNKHLVSISMDSTLRVWDHHVGQCVRNVLAHGSSIFNLRTSPLHAWLAVSAGDDAILAAHDFRLKSTVTQRFIGHEKTLWGCDIRYDEGQFISCGMDSKVMTWDPRNPSAPLSTFAVHKNPVHCVEYMPDGETFLSSSRDRSFCLTVAESGRKVFSCVGHEGNVYKVTYNAAVDICMTCGGDATVKIWKLPRLLE